MAVCTSNEDVYMYMQSAALEYTAYIKKCVSEKTEFKYISTCTRVCIVMYLESIIIPYFEQTQYTDSFHLQGMLFYLSFYVCTAYVTHELSHHHHHPNSTHGNFISALPNVTFYTTHP